MTVTLLSPNGLYTYKVNDKPETALALFYGGVPDDTGAHPPLDDHAVVWGVS